MAIGNEVSRSSKGPIGDFPLEPPWVTHAREDLRDYWKALGEGNDLLCAAIETRHGLYGASPEHVTKALKKIIGD